MKVIYTALFLSLITITSSGQSMKRFTISGYVKETISSETLIGVNIYLPDRQTGTVTNNYGFYSITLPASDSVKLVISYVGFATKTININLQKDIEPVLSLPGFHN